MFRSTIRLFTALVAAVGLATCSDAPSTAARPAVGRARAQLGFLPVFSPSARATAARLDDFGISFDRVRVVIVRPVADTVKDTTVTFRPGQADLTLDLTVNVNVIGESFQAGIDYANQNGVVFHGQGTVQSHAPDEPAPPQQIAVQYTGPGANVTRVAVTPKATTVVSPATATFAATAFDASGVAVPGTPFSWTSSDASVASVSNTGTLTPTGKRGTVTVTATTPNGASDNATLTVSLPGNTLSLVSGGGQTGKAGTALPQPAVVRVTATDGLGVPGVSVNFAAPIGGKVGSATVVTDANGLASTSLTLAGTIGAQSFAAAAFGQSVSIPETAVQGDAAGVTAVSGGGQTDTVKHALRQPFVVKVVDQFGNPVGNVTVTWTRTAGTGTLSGTTSVSGADGLASIGYTLGASTGTETVTASVGGATSVATFGATAIAAGPSTVTIVSGSGQIGRILEALAPFVIQVTDENGNPVKDAAVTWSATNGTFASSTTTTDATGQSSNALTLGSASGRATATATVNGHAVTFTATVQTGVVAKMIFQTQPPGAVASGAPIRPAVQVALQDAGGNLASSTNTVTIALGQSTNGGRLTGTLTRSAVGGIATFDDLVIDRVGAGYTLVATSNGIPAITSAPFSVGFGAPGRLIVLAGDGQTGTVNSLASVVPSVKLVDLNNNVLAGALVAFKPAPGSGTIVPAGTVSTDAQGIATLTSWTFGTAAGAQLITVSSPGVESVTINATAQPGVAAQLTVNTQPSSSAQSGIAFATQPQIQLRDAFGNPKLQSGVTVSVAIASGGGTLSGTTSAVTDALGRATFADLRINGTAGARTLVFTSTGLTSVTSTAITLTPGTPALLSFFTNPTGAAASQPIAPPVAVRVLDADGNVVTSASNSVSLAITAGTGPSGASLAGTTTVAASSGTASFANVSIATSGQGYTLTATSAGLTSAISTPFNVAPGSASRLLIVGGEGQTGVVNTAASAPPSVRVLDASSNPVVGAAVTFTPATGSGAVSPSTPVTTNSFGVATLASWTFGTAAGAQSLTVTSPGTNTVTIHATVQAGPVTHLIVTASPTTQVAGGTTSVTAQLVDAFNNPSLTSGRTISWSSTGGGSFSPPQTVTGANGATPATVFTTTSVAGLTQTLIATDAGTPSDTGSTSVTTTAGSATRLSITTQPSTTAQSGAPFARQPIIQLLDANNNVAPQNGVTVTASIASGGGTLGGTTTAVTNAQGQAAFTNLRINGTAGNRTLGFTAVGLTGVTSTSIALTAGVAAKLAYSTQPSNAAAGAAISPTVTVTVLDADNNVVTSATNAVTLAITSGTGTAGATLGGTTSVAPVNGVASFPGVSINTAGTGYTLTATSAGLTAAVSNTFNITAPPPTLTSVAPAQADAVFTNVPVTLNGTNFINGNTTLSLAGTGLTATNLAFVNANLLTATFNIAGGAATSDVIVTATTAGGTSNGLVFNLYAVGSAPPLFGASHGGSGGSPYDLSCGASSVVTGLSASTGGFGSVSELQIICQSVSGASRTFGAQQFSANVGGTGGTHTTLACPANSVLVGLTGRIGSDGSGANDQIAGVCQPITGGATTTTTSLGFNQPGSIDYTEVCPTGLAVVGITGGAGNLIDRTQIKCG